jgi:hypothetical protein
VSEDSAPPDLDELTRRLTDAFNRRDFDAIMAAYSPSPVWDTSAVGLGTHGGREAVRAFHEDWLQAYEELEMVSTELLDLGNGVSVTVFDQRGRPNGGSAFVELRFALVTVWTEGLVEQIIAYTDVDEARAGAERLAQERSQHT